MERGTPGENGSERAGARIERLRQRYPGIREDSEYFIYDLTDRDGNHIEAHTPKWEKIPLKLDASHTVYVPVTDVIETEMELRHLYGRDDFSLVDALRRAGRLP